MRKWTFHIKIKGKKVVFRPNVQLVSTFCPPPKWTFSALQTSGKARCPVVHLFPIVNNKLYIYINLLFSILVRNRWTKWTNEAGTTLDGQKCPITGWTSVDISGQKIKIL